MEVISTADQVAQTYSKPFSSILPYYLLSIILSFLIILSLIILEWSFVKFDFITLIFKMMFSVTGRRIRCFQVDVSQRPEYRAIRAACKWILRSTTVTILCFLWQSCLLYQKTRAVSETPDPTMFNQFCNSGLACIYYINSYRPLFLWAISEEVVDVCLLANNEEDWKRAITSKGYITCVGIPKLDSMDVVVRLSIAYALSQLMLGAFQFLSWIVFRSRSPFVSLLYLILSAISFVLFFVALAVPQLFIVNSWFTSACYIALPVMLLCSRTTGVAAMTALQQQLLFNKSVDAKMFDFALSQSQGGQTFASTPSALTQKQVQMRTTGRSTTT